MRASTTPTRGDEESLARSKQEFQREAFFSTSLILVALSLSLFFAYKGSLPRYVFGGFTVLVSLPVLVVLGRALVRRLAFEYVWDEPTRHVHTRYTAKAVREARKAGISPARYAEWRAACPDVTLPRLTQAYVKAPNADYMDAVFALAKEAVGRFRVADALVSSAAPLERVNEWTAHVHSVPGDDIVEAVKAGIDPATWMGWRTALKTQGSHRHMSDLMRTRLSVRFVAAKIHPDVVARGIASHPNGASGYLGLVEMLTDSLVRADATLCEGPDVTRLAVEWATAVIRGSVKTSAPLKPSVAELHEWQTAFGMDAPVFAFMFPTCEQAQEAYAADTSVRKRVVAFAALAA